MHSWRRLVGLAASIVALVLVAAFGAFGAGPAGAAISTTQVQWDLAGLGYLSFSGIDGVQGPITTAAIKSFQTDRCITVDGVVGPQTEGALASVVEQVQSPVGTTVDGYYGPNTKAAVASWQAAHGLSADGVAGPQTMAAMGIARSACTQPPPPPGGVVSGMDVSNYQGNVDWTTAYANGARFVYIKATEGTYYTSSSFAQQYSGSYNVGMIRGAYHFANPSDSSGATQADFFVAHGGGWSADGRTLPGALDIEYNPYGSECYGLSQSSMVSWIADFSNEYHNQTGVYPAIYSTTDWWSTCTGNSAAFGSTNPLWIARYSSSAGTLPAGWGTYTFWQNADSGVFPGDQDQFNGDMTQLQAVACAGHC